MRDENVCVFCGKTSNTRDHIPSKNLFDETCGVNFLTVPSCEKCNQGFSLDEEFFRNFIATLTFDLSLNSTNLFNSKIKRAIQRRPKLAQNMFSRMSLVDVDLHGRNLGKRTAIEINDSDHQRVFNVLDKYIKGLFFDHFGQVFPADHEIKHFWANDKLIEQHKSIIQDLKWITFDPNVFAYGFGYVPDTFRTVYMTVFFDKVVFLSFTKPKNDIIMK